MQETAWLLEPIRIWLEGGNWAEIKASEGFVALALLSAAIVPSTLIMIGIGGWSEWRQTPFAQWFGFAPEAPDANWVERARDIDKDGAPDI